ncbi:hypothetical protein NW768_011237 [Fusarium equiseti]|uniref:Orc1-like AAA ATPase domain-containing protein n=1 Tax=Fusarium equiseti TaxID=61235 RepID=A0ABQ8QY68_FUSEQ|nr:hypothetical protein NW768_011237 [Fusarium equiseti]
MERNSPWLQELQSDYNAISQDVETIFFYETLKLDVGPMSLLIVPKHSAVISGARNSEDVPLIADHASMVKFSTRTDDGFQKLVKRLRIFAKAAKPKIDENWKDWEWLTGPRSTQRQQSTAAQDDKEFLLGIVPNIVRNPYFTGRNEILNSLGQKLSSTRRTKKSNVVVLHGAGGMGKTQIAIEFMYRHEADYTSLFWIDGSRDYTAASDVLTSIKTIQRHYEVHGLRKKHWYGHIKETLANRLERARIQKHQIPTDNLSDADDQSLQEMFLAWLSSDGNCGWLMVIDNVDDLKRFDFRDWLAPTLCGSIIITSRLSDLARHWASIEVDGMTIEESIRLLNESSRAVPADESSQGAF